MYVTQDEPGDREIQENRIKVLDKMSGFSVCRLSRRAGLRQGPWPPIRAARPRPQVGRFSGRRISFLCHDLEADGEHQIVTLWEQKICKI